MAKHFLTILILKFVTFSFGQTRYEPKILILAPNTTRYDKVFEKEIIDFNNDIKNQLKLNQQKQAEFINSPGFKKKPKNVRAIYKNEIEFAKHSDFFKQVTSVSEKIIIFRLFDYFPKLLLELKDVKSDGSLNDLKKKSETEKFQYIINFPSIELYKKDTASYAKVAVQLYNGNSNTIMIDTIFIGNWYNPGSILTCSEHSINCTINNALAQAFQGVVDTIVAHNPTLIFENQLDQARFTILSKEYYKSVFDKGILKKIITPLDSNISIDIAYQVLFNLDSTKFISFFLNFSSEYVSAYTVQGIKFKDKWYYEQGHRNSFKAESLEKGRLEFFNILQQFNFFKDNSTDFNPKFWETEQFNKNNFKYLIKTK